MKKGIILLLFILSFSGCLNTVIHLNSNQMEPKPVKNIAYPSLALGLVELKKFKGQLTYCKDTGIQTVHIFRNARDSILHFIIGAFYTSRSIEIHCEK